MVRTTFSTACSPPLPRDRKASPSRSSVASRLPVLASLGTLADAEMPLSSTTSTATVGVPRESRISKASMMIIRNLQPRMNGWRHHPHR